MKHKITADKHRDFVRNIQTLDENLTKTGKKIVKCKTKMTTLNSDYDGYRRRYVGTFWDE